MKKVSLFVIVLSFAAAGVSLACDEKGVHSTQGDSAACATAESKVQPAVTAKAEIKEVAVKVEGLHCASCAAKINEALQKTGGVVGLDVDLDKKVCKIKYDAKRVTPKDLVSCINKNTPYKASLN